MSRHRSEQVALACFSCLLWTPRKLLRGNSCGEKTRNEAWFWDQHGGLSISRPDLYLLCFTFLTSCPRSQSHPHAHSDPCPAAWLSYPPVWSYATLSPMLYARYALCMPSPPQFSNPTLLARLHKFCFYQWELKVPILWSKTDGRSGKEEGTYMDYLS